LVTRVFTIDEVAEILKVNPRTVNRLIERGELKAAKVGRVYRITEQALNEFLNLPDATEEETK
jgi:excisionase family DNA binding protein